MAPDPAVATYSIVACDREAGQWGVATQSKFLAVGSVVPWAEPQVGAIATQSYANPRYGPDGLALLRQGLSAEEVVERLTAADEGRDQRQLGVVDGKGVGATFTGPECMDWAGGRTGPCYAAQGNILVSDATVDAIAETFERTTGAPLAERLLDCLDAAQAAGGDSRGQQAAALLVVERDGGYAGRSDNIVDLRVDDHELPLTELRRIYGLHHAIFGKTPRDEWLGADAELAAELRERLARLGHEGELGTAFFAWAGSENLEDRVDGVEQVDPVVLDELRRQTGASGSTASRGSTTSSRIPFRVRAGSPGGRCAGTSTSARSAPTPTPQRRPASGWSRSTARRTATTSSTWSSRGARPSRSTATSTTHRRGRSCTARPARCAVRSRRSPGQQSWGSAPRPARCSSRQAGSGPSQASPCSTRETRRAHGGSCRPASPSTRTPGRATSTWPASRRGSATRTRHSTSSSRRRSATRRRSPSGRPTARTPPPSRTTRAS